jgi:predicted RNA binding protein YcfA (HicA-like mRNA interferase family)
VLEKNGFVFVSQKGSHAKYRKIDVDVVITVIVPTPRKEIPLGTFRSILRQSKLSQGDFLM